MENIVVNVEEKRGYFSITYFKAKTKSEYEINKMVLGYYDIPKDCVANARDFINKIKHYYIECLSDKELLFVRDKKLSTRLK